MSLLPSRMQFADIGDFKPLGKPLRHREERNARSGAAIAKLKPFEDFEDKDHGAADGGCLQERLPNMLGNAAALKAAYSDAANGVTTLFTVTRDPARGQGGQLAYFEDFAKAKAQARAPTDAEVKNFYKRAALGQVKDVERAEFEARMKLRVVPWSRS